VSNLIPLGLFGPLVGGLFIVYLTIYSVVFRSIRELETDFTRVIVPNFKEQQSSKFLDFFSEEAGRYSAKIDDLTQERITDVQFQSYKTELKGKIVATLKDFRKTFKDCLIAEILLNRIDSLEKRGRIWCVVGIILVLPSIAVYIVSKGTLKVHFLILIIILLAVPIFVCTVLAIINVRLTFKLRQKMKEVEQIWET